MLLIFNYKISLFLQLDFYSKYDSITYSNFYVGVINERYFRNARHISTYLNLI